MLARRFCIFNAGLKVDVSREISTMIMTSNDENVRSCKRHTIVHRAFFFWRSLCPFLASRVTTMSLDTYQSSHSYVLQHILSIIASVLMLSLKSLVARNYVLITTLLQSAYLNFSPSTTKCYKKHFTDSTFQYG